MARLYWRVKRNGKWTFVPVVPLGGMHQYEVANEAIEYLVEKPECEHE